MRKVTSKRSHRKGHSRRLEKTANIMKVTSGQNIVNMLINCLQYFKHKLGRKALETPYKSFSVPLIFILSSTVVPVPNLTHSKTVILKPCKVSLVCPGNKPSKNCITSPDFVH